MKKKKIIPTPKQRKAAELVIGNLKADKPQPIRAILLQAGYSQNVADSPQNVTESKGFIKCIEQAGATDDKLSQVLMEGLNAKRPWGKNGDIYADYGVRHKYMETALKLKGYKLDRPEPPTGDTYNTFVQQNNLDPNTPDNKVLVDKMVEVLMEQTKAV